MKSLIILAALAAVCVAIPQGMMGSQLPQQSSEMPRKPPVPILKFEYNNDNNGVYSVSSQGGDQTQVQEKGEPRDLGDKEGPVIVKSGSFSYIGTDGLTYSVNWVADQEGFKPQGQHLPTTPAPLPGQ